MLLDFHEWAGSRFRDAVFDVCVCGAGPAGITLARQLASKGHTVALMEGGGLEPDEASQGLYRGDNIGHPYFPLDACRLRYLGGTSNHWVGYTRPLDDRDFGPLPQHQLNEWPIGKHDLDPYAEAAASILDLAPTRPTTDVFRPSTGFLLPANFRMSAPTRFGRKYRDELTQSPAIALCLNANLINVDLEAGLGTVSRLAFRSTSGSSEQFFVRARFYALCCGGLENARILLNANQQVSNGIGNTHDLVGRFFSDHIEAVLGHAILASPLRERSEYVVTDAHLRERRCLSYIIGLLPQRGSSRCESTSFVDRIERALRGRGSTCFDCMVELQAQQTLNRDSRVTLSDKRDRFGLRQLALDWQLSPLDALTARSAALDVAEALARHDIGRIQLAPFLRHETTVAELTSHCIGQYHHMCTTRMSDGPQTGVVDADCRVHAVDNLYMGGSSVFSSGGVSNPTYTIVQLALRLGDHLHRRLA